MKNTILLGFNIFCSFGLFGQVQPTISSPPNGGQTSGEYWSRAGNNVSGNNIFGTKWNSPIYTVTGNGFPAGNTYRMKLNAIFNIPTQYGIDGYNTFGNTNTTVNTTGYMLLGSNGTFQTQSNLSIYNDKGAFSLLHLNGTAPIQQNGYRPWMKTGITFTDNQDMSYFGLRQIGTGLDWTETVMNWSDNQGGLEDDMCFRFTGAPTSSTTIDMANLRSTVDLDGLHIARYTANGRYALGNTFGYIAAPGHPLGYVAPQSLFHMSYDRQNGAANEAYGFMQVTYRDAGAVLGSGETEQDGLRLGIDNDIIISGGVNTISSYLRWQENTPFIVQTDWNNTPGGIQNGERLRVSSINAPGVPNPLGLNANTTRVAISYDGSNPITQPRSLLHLGYNTGTLLGPGGAADGWRNWMEIGAFTSNGTDNMYIGLKNEGTDRMDAVVNWGDNQVAGLSPNGPDHLRFIFTSTTTALPPGQGNPVSQSNNGLETGRFYPGYDTTFTYNYQNPAFNTAPTKYYGRFGVGDFTTSGVNEEPTHKLDVVGNGRFRFLPDSLYMSDTTVTKFVMVDSAGVLRWSNVSPGGFGASCSDSINGKLNFDTKEDLNNYNLYFTNNDSLGQNHVGVGFNCGDILPGKMSVFQTHPDSVNASTYAYYGRNNDITDTVGTIHGVFYGISNGVQPSSIFTMNQGAYLEATNSKFNMGIFTYANGATVPVSNNTAGAFRAYSGAVGMGVYGTSVGATSNNFGLLGSANGGANSYGVYAAASGSTNTNTAGYFVGDVIANGNYLSSSDQQFKTNVMPVESALKIVSNLNPKSYYFDTVNYEQFNFGSEKQYGFIAQEVELTLPALVHNSVHPGVYDSIGNQIVPATTYKSLNYNAIIPINTQAIKELNVKVDKATLSDQTIKTNVQDLTGSLDKVLEMRGVTYEWNGANHPNLQLDSVMHIGFIAQEINAIDPLLTFMDEDTLMHVEYDKVVPILAEAIQELNGQVVSQDSIIEALTNENVAQQAQIEDLNDRLTQLENCLSGILPFLCQMNNSSIQPTQQEVQEQLRTAINVNLSNKNAIVLNQNVPNPFAESTTITYSVPSSVQKAQIHFYDGTGKLINTVDITERGNGQLNVFANDLSSGVYTYSLVADGQVVSTKRMVKE